MKYRALAKGFQFVKGSLTDPTREDAAWLTAGEKKKFTDKQLDKLNAAFAEVVSSMQEKLEKQGLDFEDMLKHLPKPGAVSNDRSASEQAAEPSDDED